MHTTRPPDNEQFIGAEIVFGATSIGHVLGVVHDPVSRRVRRLITSYGPDGRRVAVPVEWVVGRTPTRVTLGVGTRSLDDLADQRQLGPLFRRTEVSRVNGTLV